MRREAYFFRRFFALAILFSMVFSALAQTRRTATKTPTAAKQVAQQAPKCAGGWSGVVSFKKMLVESFESDEPGIRKAKDRIKQKKSRDYDYSARRRR
jgi:hypothetical protein